MAGCMWMVGSVFDHCMSQMKCNHTWTQSKPQSKLPVLRALKLPPDPAVERGRRKQPDETMHWGIIGTEEEHRVDCSKMLQDLNTSQESVKKCRAALQEQKHRRASSHLCIHHAHIILRCITPHTSPYIMHTSYCDA